MTQSQAFKLLKTGTSVFLTGKPGSGKTHLVNTYVTWLRNHDIQVAVTASTGIAATHIGGMTIHSWSGIGIKDSLDKRTIKQIADKSHIKSRIKKTKVLIIDEISMLSPNTLDMVDAVCRTVLQTLQPFGGMQLVLVGDFFQLPPVKQASISTPVVFAYQSQSWNTLNPTICYLNEQFRQNDDKFLDILSAIRQNQFQEHHLSHLEPRKTPANKIPPDTPWLFSHNRNVDSFNQAKLNKINAPTQEFKQESIGARPLVEALTRGCLSPAILQLKQSAVVMFTKNCPKGTFVNGTLGIVSGFNKKTGLPLVEVETGLIIEAKPMDWTIEEHGKIRASISQVPLRLAWAITIHKSQGLSLDRVTMDLSKVFEYGQGYVALSRVRQLKGLYLLGWNRQAFMVHPQILEQDKVFQTQSGKTQKQHQVSTEKIHQFIVKAGGSIKKIKNKIDRPKTKQKTQEITLELWNKNNNIAQIAKQRKLTEGTILNHIEQLVAEEKISKTEVKKLLTPVLKKDLSDIHSAFKELNTDQLTPVLKHLNHAYTYNELRLARILI